MTARAALGPFYVGVGYYAAAAIALRFTHGSDDIATIWPSSGVLFSALLLASPRTWGRYVAAAALASLLANLGAGVPLPTAIGFTIANVAESSVAAWLLRRRAGCGLSFDDPAGLACFCTASAFAAALSALLALVSAPVASFGFLASWFTTDLLGMLVVTPMIVIGAELWRSGWPTDAGARSAGAVGAMLVVIAATALTFCQSGLPLLFVPMIALLLAVVRMGTLGAAASVFVIGAGSTLATNLGRGPVILIHDDETIKILFLQFYLLALFASALPVAALLAARNRLAAAMEEKNRLLGMAESMAAIGHWRVQGAARTLSWSDEVFRIYGIPQGPTPPLARVIDAYHPDDRPLIAATIERARSTGGQFRFTSRITRTDGSVRHLSCRGEASIAADGSVDLFGVIQDVTAAVEAERQLEGARSAAEDAARIATQRAETDELTGLPNRRRLLSMLDDAIAEGDLRGGGVAIAMLDVDHFKTVNDTYGHAVGDEVLRRVARSASAALRAHDMLGRVGGEEFVVVLPGADRDRATDVAERLRRAIEAADPGSDLPTVSASFGVAIWQPGEAAGDLLRRADRALYDAKAAGRNTLRVAA